MMKSTKRVALAVFGVFVILGAVVFLLDRMGVFSFALNYHVCIAAVLFVYGLLGFVGLTASGSSRIFQFGVMLFGAALLAKYQPWMPAVSGAFASIKAWHLFLVCLAIVIGISILSKAITGKSGFVEFEIGSDDDDDEASGGAREVSDGRHVSNVFNSRTISFDGQPFEGYELDSVFGEVTLDLSNAIIEHDCVLKVSSVFGSVKIITGTAANFVVTKGDSVFGSAKSYKNGSTDGIPTVSIHADAIFGSVEVL